MLYILQRYTRKPIPVNDPASWAMWMVNNNRHVGRDTVGDLLISTVFLGVNYNHLGKGKPLLFETMVFGNDDAYCERHSSWDDAKAAHDALVKEVTRLHAMAQDATSAILKGLRAAAARR